MIDPRQRYDDTEAIIRQALGANQASIWTVMPGLVYNYNATASTVDVQLAISGAVQFKDGTTQPQNYPLLHDLPVVFPGGGNCTLTFPIAQGDECLVVFASRSIDNWWKWGAWPSGQPTPVPQPPAESRMHDLSDGFALFRPFSQPNKLSGVSTSTAQLRSNDGSTYVELNASGQIVNIVAPGGINITGNLTVNGTTQLNGNATSTGTLTGQTDVIAGTGGSAISSIHHVHSGVQSGGSLTGASQG
jgi:hypothetical protein